MLQIDVGRIAKELVLPIHIQAGSLGWSPARPITPSAVLLVTLRGQIIALPAGSQRKTQFWRYGIKQGAVQLFVSATLPTIPNARRSMSQN